MAMTVSAADGSLLIDLAVDTSAVMAVLLREPTSDAILQRLCVAVQPALAAPILTEIQLVALVKLGEIGLERAREFLDQQAMVTVCWDQELADGAAMAFGDCFSYALAERLRVPLLFVGNDFARTDLESAL